MTLKRQIMIISVIFALGVNSGGLGTPFGISADNQMAEKPIKESEVTISRPRLSTIDSKDQLSLPRGETADRSNPGRKNSETDQKIPSPQSSLLSRDSSVSLLAFYTEHDPIYIWHNDNFTDLGFLGGGTPMAPYQIVGLNITNMTGPLIEIRDTTAYFNISGNLLDGLEQASRGIELHNVSHGRIERNTAVNCTTDGIWLESSNNSILFKNTVNNNDWTGIKLTASSNHNIIANNSASSNEEAGIWLGEAGSCFNNTVANNTVSNSNWAGIQIDASINNTLSDNTLFSNFGGGIALASSNNHTIIGNAIYDNYGGIIIGGTGGSHGNSILHNVIDNNGDNSDSGIFLDASNNTTIANNTVSRNNWGIVFYSSNNTLVTGNTVHDSAVDGIADYSSKNNTISNNTIYTNDLNGIRLESLANNNTVFNNTIYSNADNGIWVGNSANNNTIANNTIYSNINSGILLGTDFGDPPTGSTNNTIIYNIIHDNGGQGITLQESSDSNLIANNTIHDSGLAGIELATSCEWNNIIQNLVYNSNWDGIRLISSNHNNTIANNTTYDNIWNGIRLEDFNNDNVIISNTVFANGEAGIWVYNNEGTWANSINRNVITYNRAFNNNWAAIFILSSNDNQISNNTVYGSEHGIELEESHNNKITNNTAYSNRRQNIRLISSTSNEISRNSLQNSTSSGILIYAADETAIFDNLVTSCGWAGHNDPDAYAAGITVMESTNVEIHDNAVKDNPDIGMQVWDSTDIRMRFNSIIGNLDFGLYVNVSTALVIASNLIANNANSGIDLEATVADCLLWGNTLRENGINAKDDGARNRWDNDSHGNWWGDYSGPDWNHDGIGDTPYVIPGDAGAQDRYPLFNVTDTTPPSIDAPIDLSYEAGTAGHSITWQTTDDHPCWYNITRNGALIAEGPWSALLISITIDGLAVGTYTYTLVVYDQVGHSATDTVIVTVTEARTTTVKPSDGDSTAPSSISPGFTVIGVLLFSLLAIAISQRRKRKGSNI